MMETLSCHVTDMTLAMTRVMTRPNQLVTKTSYKAWQIDVLLIFQALLTEYICCNVWVSQSSIILKYLAELISTKTPRRIRAIVVQEDESMNIKWHINILAVAGIASSVTYLISEHATLGFTVFLSIWLLLPYVLLVWLNESRSGLNRRPIACLLLTIVMLSIGAIFMLDTAVFHPDPLGEIAMIFLPPLQTVCLVGIWELGKS
jgi:hypothetical protein